MTENAAPGTAVGDPVTASDADGDAISYELAGRDAGAFAIDAATGQLRTKAGVFYDYEIKNSYTVTVVADDGNGNTDTAVVTIALTNVAAEVLTADIEGAPAAHNGAPFVVHLVFSEPTSLGFRTVRDSLLSVTNGRVTRARRADLARGLKKIAGDHLSARWEVTVEPAGGDVTIALPATTDCDAAAAVCTRDRRPLSAGVSEAVAAGTVPVLTASFVGAPEEHDGSKAFTLELNFNAAVTTSRGDMRTHALRVTNGRLTGASRQRGRRDRWLLTVEPSSLKDVTVALSATASCDDSGAVCAVDGRILSSPEEVSVIGPASIPLTGEGEKHLPVYRREPFEFGIKFSWAVKITPAVMKQHAFTVTNAEIVSAYKVGDDSGRHWRITALPLSTRLIEIVLPATTDCADPGAVCTRDGRMLSNEYDWFFMYLFPDRIDRFQRRPLPLRRRDRARPAVPPGRGSGIPAARLPAPARRPCPGHRRSPVWRRRVVHPGTGRPVGGRRRPAGRRDRPSRAFLRQSATAPVGRYASFGSPVDRRRSRYYGAVCAALQRGGVGRRLVDMPLRCLQHRRG